MSKNADAEDSLALKLKNFWIPTAPFLPSNHSRYRWSMEFKLPKSTEEVLSYYLRQMAVMVSRRPGSTFNRAMIRSLHRHTQHFRQQILVQRTRVPLLTFPRHRFETLTHPSPRFPIFHPYRMNHPRLLYAPTMLLNRNRCTILKNGQIYINTFNPDFHYCRSV